MTPLQIVFTVLCVLAVAVVLAESSRLARRTRLYRLNEWRVNAWGLHLSVVKTNAKWHACGSPPTGKLRDDVRHAESVFSAHMRALPLE